MKKSANEFLPFKTNFTKFVWKVKLSSLFSLFSLHLAQNSISMLSSSPSLPLFTPSAFYILPNILPSKRTYLPTRAEEERTRRRPPSLRTRAALPTINFGNNFWITARCVSWPGAWDPAPPARFATKGCSLNRVELWRGAIRRRRGCSYASG